ncbi:MAG: DUF3800 domain-containing protein [Betaproteobacteria bacterium]
MSDGGVTHVGFSDESNWNVGRFRSLGLVTAPVDFIDELEANLRSILQESGLSEFKWKELRGAKERFAAEKMCKFAVDKACAKQIRVDVLIWDIEDSRHKIRKRDDIANLQRMHYHLFRNVLRVRWPDGSRWRLHPDEQTAMNWDTVQDCLSSASVELETEHSLFTEGGFRRRLRQEFALEEVRPVLSHEHPLAQLADLFAGLAVFSRDSFVEYQKWLGQRANQQSLFEGEQNEVSPSRSSLERFEVLCKFDGLCKTLRLGVSLIEKRGLWTPDPRNPINFWMYEPQHELDKAPQKGSVQANSTRPK